MPPVVLTGREPEERRIGAVLDRLTSADGDLTGDADSVLLIRGEAGVGKTALLEAAEEAAAQRGAGIRRVAGVPSEAAFPYAGLQQLLGRDLGGRVKRLPRPQGQAISAALGALDGEATPFLVSLATLNLLAESASARPLLLIVEDAHWLDPASAEALAFVARRIESEPMAMLIAARPEHALPFDGTGLPELTLGPLEPPAATELLARVSPSLGPAARDRVLATATGNPLALLELPSLLEGDELEAGAPLPLSARLERAFAHREAELPAATRSLLLIAAVSEEPFVTEVLAAGGVLSPGSGMDDLSTAASAGLIDLEGPMVRFRHPLVRSAIYQAAEAGARREAHAALAEALGDQPRRRIWHRAAAAVEESEEIAVELVRLAEDSVRRGGAAIAVAALRRAAGLGGAVGRADRLLRAAELAFELGRIDLVEELAAELGPLSLSSSQRARLTWVRESFTDGKPGDAARIKELLDAANAAAGHDSDLALSLLHGAALRCWWADPGEEARRVVARAGAALGAENDPRRLVVLAVADPIREGEAVISRLAAASREHAQDPLGLLLLGESAHAVAEFERSSRLFDQASIPLREQGRLALLVQALTMRAWDAVQLGNWGVAEEASAEAHRLAEETAQPVWRAGSQLAGAAVAAVRGQDQRAEALIADAERVTVPAGLSALVASGQLGRGIAAIAAGRHQDAFEQLRSMFDPGNDAFHRMDRFGGLGYLADAAVQCGRREEAQTVLDELESVGVRTPSTGISVALAYSRAVLAADGEAEELLTGALAGVAGRQPFVRARLELVRGVRLRRQRRMADSRAPLRAALKIFDALGAQAWSDRAHQELRASGETSRRRVPETRDDLTPQELQIARLAGDGMTNKEIGEWLFLSPRTVASHLYRAFPKLGITSRSQLPGGLPPE